MDPAIHVVLDTARKVHERGEQATKYLAKNEGMMMSWISWADDAAAACWFMPVVLLLTWPSGIPATVDQATFQFGIYLTASLLYCLALGSRFTSYVRDGYVWHTAVWDAGFSSLLLFPHVFLGYFGLLEFVPNGLDFLFIIFTDMLGILAAGSFIGLAFKTPKPPLALLKKMPPAS